MTAHEIVETLLAESPKLEKLKKARRPLTPEEKAAFPTDLPAGDCATILKAVVDGETWYACYTHRSCQISKSIKAIVKAYPQVASSA